MIRYFADITLQIKLIVMIHLGLAYAVFNWKPFELDSRLERVRSLELSLSNHFSYYGIKTLLGFTVFLEYFCNTILPFEYLLNLYTVVTWSRSFFLVPWIVTYSVNHILTKFFSFTIVAVLFAKHQVTALSLMEFLFVEFVNFSIAAYNWYVFYTFYHSLRLVEVKRALLIHEIRHSYDSLELDLTAEVNFTDIVNRVSADSFDWKLLQATESLREIAQGAWADSDEDGSTDYINLSPVKRTMKILDITPEELADSETGSTSVTSSSPDEDDSLDHEEPKRRKSKDERARRRSSSPKPRRKSSGIRFSKDGNIIEPKLEKARRKSKDKRKSETKDVEKLPHESKPKEDDSVEVIGCACDSEYYSDSGTTCSFSDRSHPSICGCNWSTDETDQQGPFFKNPGTSNSFFEQREPKNFLGTASNSHVGLPTKYINQANHRLKNAVLDVLMSPKSSLSQKEIHFRIGKNFKLLNLMYSNVNWENQAVRNHGMRKWLIFHHELEEKMDGNVFLNESRSLINALKSSELRKARRDNSTQTDYKKKRKIKILSKKYVHPAFLTSHSKKQIGIKDYYKSPVQEWLNTVEVPKKNFSVYHHPAKKSSDRALHPSLRTPMVYSIASNVRYRKSNICVLKSIKPSEWSKYIEEKKARELRHLKAYNKLTLEQDRREMQHSTKKKKKSKLSGHKKVTIPLTIHTSEITIPGKEFETHRPSKSHHGPPLFNNSIMDWESQVPVGVDPVDDVKQDTTILSDLDNTVFDNLITVNDITSTYESSYYRSNLRQRIDGIDWSTNYPCDHQSPKTQLPRRSSGVSPMDRRVIVDDETLNQLQNAFSFSDESERGFQLGPELNEPYPIFQVVALTMAEIFKATGWRRVASCTEMEVLITDDSIICGSEIIFEDSRPEETVEDESVDTRIDEEIEQRKIVSTNLLRQLQQLLESSRETLSALENSRHDAINRSKMLMFDVSEEFFTKCTSKYIDAFKELTICSEKINDELKNLILATDFEGAGDMDPKGCTSKIRAKIVGMILENQMKLGIKEYSDLKLSHRSNIVSSEPSCSRAFQVAQRQEFKNHHFRFNFGEEDNLVELFNNFYKYLMDRLRASFDGDDDELHHQLKILGRTENFLNFISLFSIEDLKFFSDIVSKTHNSQHNCNFSSEKINDVTITEIELHNSDFQDTISNGSDKKSAITSTRHDLMWSDTEDASSLAVHYDGDNQELDYYDCEEEPVREHETIIDSID